MNIDKKVSCFVVDDEPDAINYLTTFIKRIPALELIGTETNSRRALDVLVKRPVDLLFVDVMMPELNGFELVHALHPRPLVILVTGHDTFGGGAFDLEAVDYLIKTVSFERFTKAVHKAMGRLGVVRQTVRVQIERDFLYVLELGNNRYTRVDFTDIYYIESQNNDLRIFISGSTYIETRMTLSQIEEALPSEYFARVHRSFIISLRKIKGFEKNGSLKLDAVQRLIPLGKHYQEDFYRIWDEIRGR